MIGKVLGQYRLIRSIGSGASATVYLGEHVSISRRAAVKVLHPHLVSDDSSIERLRREAQALSALNHDNIVKIYDFVLEKENAFIVFEYVEGCTLRQFVDAHPDLPPELAAAFMLEICRAVAAAHELNIIHRDIKPENILITGNGKVKLTDFGIARLTEMENLTVTGSLMGSPNFMSPEQIECFPVDKTSDIFSLGVLFYYLLTRTFPFGAKSQARIIRNVLSGRYVPPDSVNLRAHPLAVRIIERCLKKRQDERYASVKDMAEKLLDLNRCFGFQDAAGEIRKAVTDYGTFRQAFEAGLLESLLKAAREAKSGKNRALALSAINHALLLDRNNRAALHLYRRLRFARRRNTAAAAVAFIAACTLLTFWFIDSRMKKPLPAAPVETVAAPAAAPAPEILPATSPRRRTSPAVFTRAAIPAEPLPAAPAESVFAQPALPAPARYGKLKVFTKPWAKLYIDNEYRGKTPFVGEFTLVEGRHVIRAENPYCADVVDTVSVAGDSAAIRKYELKRSSSP